MISNKLKDALRNLLFMDEEPLNPRVKEMIDYMESAADDDENELSDNPDIAREQAAKSLDEMLQKADELELTDTELLFTIVIES